MPETACFYEAKKQFFLQDLLDDGPVDGDGDVRDQLRVRGRGGGRDRRPGRPVPLHRVPLRPGHGARDRAQPGDAPRQLLGEAKKNFFMSAILVLRGEHFAAEVAF